MRASPRTFSDVEAYLDGLGLFHMDLTLDRVSAVLARLDLVRLPCAVVQVAGTNGKGSTAHFLASLARAHGLVDGLYTSPHFRTPRERIRVNGAMLNGGAWAHLAGRVLDTPGGRELTYFELLTVIAALGFAEAGVEVAVFEAGLGGRYDATTALDADALLYARIGLDHERLLGDTVARIAADKAGALRAGRPAWGALSGPQRPEALAELARSAAEAGVALRVVDDEAETAPGWDESLFAADMPGRADNARLALAGWRLVAERRGWESDAAKVRAVLASARLPGRLQHVPASESLPELILDGAHNEDALHMLAAGLARLGVRPAAVIFTCMRDKTLERMAPTLLELGDGPVLVPGLTETERSWRPEALARELGPRARAVPDIGAALREAGEIAAQGAGPVLVCGSLYLLADFYTLHPQLLEAD